MNIAMYQDHHNEMLCHWSVKNVVEAINSKEGHEAFAFSSPKDPRIEHTDVVIFYRTGTHVRLYMQKLRAQGKTVGYFVDDWLWSPALAPQGLCHTIVPFFDSIDFMMVPNQKLAEKVKAITSLKTIVIDPGIDEATHSILANRPLLESKEHFNILVTKGHVNKTFVENVQPIFDVLEEMKPEQKIRVIYFFSHDLGFKNKENVSYERHNPVVFKNFYPTLATLPIDLILNPVPEDDFHDCKCPLKYFESASLGVPLLTGRTFPFTSALKDFDDVLFASSPDEYASKIAWALQWPTKAAAIGERSKTTLEAKFKIQKNISKFLVDIQVLLEPKVPSIPVVNPKVQEKEEIAKIEKDRKEREAKLSPVRPVQDSHRKDIERFIGESSHLYSSSNLQNSFDFYSQHINAVCVPLTYNSTLEMSFDYEGTTITRIDVLGATYQSKITQAPRFDIYCGTRLMTSGHISPSTMVDNDWWSLVFPEFSLEQKRLTFKIHNLDRNPFCFYLAKHIDLGQQCLVNKTKTDPIAVRLY